MRRMELLDVTQTGTPLDLVREIEAMTISAEWETFSRNAAICHLFMRKVKCEQSRKVVYKILSDNAKGDYKSLISELQVIEAQAIMRKMGE